MVPPGHWGNRRVQPVPELSDFSCIVVVPRCVAAKKNHWGALVLPAGLQDASWRPCCGTNGALRLADRNEYTIVCVGGLSGDNCPSFT